MNPSAHGNNIAAKFGEFKDESTVDGSIEDKSLKSPGAKGTSVSFKSDVPNPLAVYNSTVRICILTPIIIANFCANLTYLLTYLLTNIGVGRDISILSFSQKSQHQ